MESLVGTRHAVKRNRRAAGFDETLLPGTLIVLGVLALLLAVVEGWVKHKAFWLLLGGGAALIHVGVFQLYAFGYLRVGKK